MSRQGARRENLQGRAKLTDLRLRGCFRRKMKKGGTRGRAFETLERGFVGEEGKGANAAS